MNLKSHLYIYICVCWALLHAATGFAQQRLPQNMRLGAMDDRTGGSHWNEVESDTIEKEGVPIGLYVWKIDPLFGTVRPAEPDTLSHLFQNDALTDGRTGRYDFTGNLGAPRQSRVFTDRRAAMYGNQFIFENPYDFFITQPGELLFTNTKSPITNLTYHSCGNKQNGEDRIRGVFATNVNKRFGLGFKLDYLYGRGYYQSQSTAHFDGTLYGSYIGERYRLHTMYYANHLKNSENGGIESDDYVDRPESFPTRYGTADMPVRLGKTWNKLNVNTFYLTHSYDFGFRRFRDASGKIVRSEASGVRGKFMNAAVSQAVAGDSVSRLAAAVTGPVDSARRDTARLVSEYVPVVGFTHTLRLDHDNRRFLSNRRASAEAPVYFDEYYLPGDSANDFTKNLRIENLLAFELREGFNSWVKSGLRLFARHEFNKFVLPDEHRFDRNYVENRFSVGAQLLKEQGRYFHYDVLGEFRTSGDDWGEFNVEGRADVNIPFLRDTLSVRLDGFVRNEQPSFYYRHYHARNAWWDNSLDKVFRTRVGGTLSYRRTRLDVHLETLRNYAYFAETQTPYVNKDGLPLAYYSVGVRQANKNVQVVSATLGQDFRWGILNWENELTYQATSDKDVLPLPALTAYSNLYLLFRIAKVLRTELGADVRYFTEYYAPAYSPIIGQYCVQDPVARVKLGNYPVLNAYVNFHLKNTRFYVMASHVNYSAGSGRPYLVPHYPLNRMVLRLGLSWNFFN